MFYPNYASLTPFRSDVSAKDQVHVGDKVVRMKEKWLSVKEGDTCEVEGFHTNGRDVCLKNLQGFYALSCFAHLPSEEKTFDDLTLGEVKKWRVKANATGEIYELRSYVYVLQQGEQKGIFECLSDLKIHYTLLPPEPIKTISRAEAEKLLAEKGMEVRISE